jgi:hypothetical protein
MWFLYSRLASHIANSSINTETHILKKITGRTLSSKTDVCFFLLQSNAKVRNPNGKTIEKNQVKSIQYET